MSNDQNKQQAGGSGSAENRGSERDEQKAQSTSVGADERQDIASQTGLKPEDIADVQQTGNLSGRDDAAGGSGDQMEGTSSNEGTDRF